MLQIRYTGFRDRPIEERQIRFQNGCRAEGRTEIAFVASGTNLQLTFNCNMTPYGHERECDFEKEAGKVSVFLGLFFALCLLFSLFSSFGLYLFVISLFLAH